VSSFGAVKRALVAATVVAAVLALSSCDSVESNDNAATVGSSEVTVAQFEKTMNALAGADGVIDPDTGTIEGDQARGLLTSMVLAEANEQFLAANDEQISDEDRSAAMAGVSLPPGTPDDVVRLVGDIRARDTAKQRVTAPSAEEVAQRYAESPTELGLVCVRQVVVATEAEAEAVVDELADGATMTELANRSIDETSKATGGEVQGENGSACMVTPQAVQVLGPEVVAALFEAGQGDIVGPVQGTGGWHVVEVRPYEEVADDANALVQQFGGLLLFEGFHSNLVIRVDPRYGRWDAAQGAVVAL
jgi:parvulin-like peptidyl-prolyl isomerase